MIAARPASRVAYATAATNVTAAAFTAVVLRHGLPGGGSTISARAGYTASHRAAWIVGWLAWNVAALSLIAFYVVLADRWRERSPNLARWALMIASAGLAADLSAEAIFMTVSPRAGIERTAIALTGFVGNGLYTLAGIALTLAGRCDLPWSILVLGAATWSAGLALCAATLSGSSTAQGVATGLLMPLFVIWSISVGRWLAHRAS